MQSDSAYLAQYPPMLQLLIEASGGDIASIPDNYLQNFHHVYMDGDVSLIPSVSCLGNIDFMESSQVEEVIETLSKVDPRAWPDCDDIVSIDGELFLASSDGEGTQDFVEDNLGTSEKTERVLKTVLESVFGKGISAIRDGSGNFPSPRNNFLQDEDGTFSGTFKFENHTFKFEIAPTEVGWICTYRMSEGSVDKLERPMYKNKRKNMAQEYRSVRSRAWR